MYKSVIILAIALLPLMLSGQSDTARKIIQTSPAEIMPTLRGSFSVPEMPSVTQPGTLPIPGKYTGLAWTPKEKLFDSTKINMSFNFGKQQTLKDLLSDNPLYALYLVVGTVAGMINHQVMGIDKEIEINTMHNIYSRSPVPPSAREPRPGDKK